MESSPAATEGCCSSSTQNSKQSNNSESFRFRLFMETVGATWMIAKFMALAFLLEGPMEFDLALYLGH
jgi:hypothetical protein